MTLPLPESLGTNGAFCSSQDTILTGRTCLSIDLKTKYRSLLVRISPALPNVKPCEAKEHTGRRLVRDADADYTKGGGLDETAQEDAGQSQKDGFKGWLHFSDCVP